jgi:hypothetical protein
MRAASGSFDFGVARRDHADEPLRFLSATDFRHDFRD